MNKAHGELVKGRFVVLREPLHARCGIAWKVLSRTFSTRQDAELWAEFQRKLSANRKYRGKIFIMQHVEPLT